MQAGATLRQAGNALINSLMPPRCAGCGIEGAYLCDDCRHRLTRLRRPYCLVCAAYGAPQLCENCAQAAPAFDAVRAPYEHRAAARAMVSDLKYRGVRAAAPHMARLLADYLSRNPYPADAIAAVPLHPRRRRKRGYNQSALLARQLSPLIGLPFHPKALRRVRNTPPQVNMRSIAARKRNIADAFRPAADNPPGLRYLLIDDVATTCGTMSACANALKDGGARSVWGIAFTRQTPRRDNPQTLLDAYDDTYDNAYSASQTIRYTAHNHLKGNVI